VFRESFTEEAEATALPFLFRGLAIEKVCELRGLVPPHHENLETRGMERGARDFERKYTSGSSATDGVLGVDLLMRQTFNNHRAELSFDGKTAAEIQVEIDRLNAELGL
jgi:hypothetical protein